MDDIQKEVASLDDSSLREQLLAAQIPIGPIVKSTRPIYEKKLIEFISKERGIANENSPTSEQDQAGSPNSKANESKAADKEVLVNSSPQTSTPKRTGSDSYFVVCIPVIECDTTDPEFITPSKAASHMFEDQKEALKLLKKNPGARFKVFRSRKDAESFAGLRENLSTPRSVEIERKEKNATLPKLSQDSPNEFRSPKAQQYVALRKAIISQDKDKFKELVWSNPRYLISTGDTPTILQEGPRYNAVHICAQKNLPEMCSLVLDILQDPEFFQRIYPDEPEQILAKRMTHIVDLYINVRDKGNFETPLHFACKFGNLEMVEFLLSYQICERSCKNRYGETPAEIICNRSNESKQDQIIIKEKIMDLLDPINEEVFIPVFRSEDNTSPPHIGQPWSPASSDSQSGQSFDSLKSPVDVDWSVKAFAGPMSPKEASDLYQRWKGRCTGRNKEDSHIQRSDEEKGLERIGRKLSQSAGVQWKEYWDFLDEFVDLATSEGLQKLENYLTVKYKELQEYTVTERDIMDDVVRDLKNQFDVMDVNEAELNNKPIRLLNDVKPNSGHCAQNLENTFSLQESCDEPTL
ncbi:putative ankyrin repeat and LEM domain-containing protein 2 [Apostichopus japonicus]|uniref:Putative ankyrin repeat and LEM domain-containing protein 2 n=1 Tax=Stichopus japonicus TaxID=307972 RepID=A0A2G8K8P3_STIJA|nr:putative ankyrin repeat and LEM domain-containing protein 2 [Apostichopus japonicus]